MKHFGETLKAAMDAKRWTAAELAEKAGVVPSTVSRHLKQADPPTRESVEKYEVVLGVILVARPKLEAMMVDVESDGLTPNKRIALAMLGEELEGWKDVPQDQYEFVHDGMVKIHFNNGKDAAPSFLLAQARRMLREARAGETGGGPPSSRPDPTEPSPERKAQLAARASRSAK